VHLVGGTGKPGGVGELCVPAAAGAVANAYARATSSKPRKFPINF
jgi:isoquinoline 1-oxidoreductase subunit beta